MTRARLAPVAYEDLNSRQREIRNFHKIAARLADFGFHSMWLSDDWQGADFLAVHIDGETIMRVQQKSRATIDRKYLGRGLHIAYLADGAVFLYLHDDLVSHWQQNVPSWGQSASWASGAVHWGAPPAWLKLWLDEHRL